MTSNACRDREDETQILHRTPATLAPSPETRVRSASCSRVAFVFVRCLCLAWYPQDPENDIQTRLRCEVEALVGGQSCPLFCAIGYIMCATPNSSPTPYKMLKAMAAILEAGARVTSRRRTSDLQIRSPAPTERCDRCSIRP